MSWTLIEHQALTSSAASVTLGSGGTIPQTYETLKLVVSPRGDYTPGGNTQIRFQFNGSGGTAYSDRTLYGNNAAAGSYSRTSQAYVYISSLVIADATANTFGNLEMTIPNYAGNTNKPISIDGVAENNSATAYEVDFVAGIWANTAAITSIAMTAAAGNFVSGSTFTLYGLA